MPHGLIGQSITFDPGGSGSTHVLLVTPSVSLLTVFSVRGPGFVSTAEQYRKLVPLISVNSTRTVLEKAEHSV